MTIYIYKISGQIFGMISKRILENDGSVILPIGKIIVRNSKIIGYDMTLSDAIVQAIDAYRNGRKQITAKPDETWKLKNFAYK